MILYLILLSVYLVLAQGLKGRSGSATISVFSKKSSLHSSLGASVQHGYTGAGREGVAGPVLGAAGVIQDFLKMVIPNDLQCPRPGRQLSADSSDSKCWVPANYFI